MTAKYNQPARIYATNPGAEIRIGTFGVATCDVGVLVPDEVADQLTREIAARPGRTDLRVVREEPKKAPSPSKPASSGEKE